MIVSNLSRNSAELAGCSRRISREFGKEPREGIEGISGVETRGQDDKAGRREFVECRRTPAGPWGNFGCGMGFGGVTG